MNNRGPGKRSRGPLLWLLIGWDISLGEARSAEEPMTYGLLPQRVSEPFLKRALNRIKYHTCAL